MSDTNIVVIKGNLTRDAELAYMTTGAAILKGGIANNVGHSTEEGWKDYTNFFNWTMFGKRAEKVAEYLKKGTAVVFTGELRHSSWEKDGVKRHKVEINVHSFSFAGGKREDAAPVTPGDDPGMFNENATDGRFEKDLPF